MAPVLVGSQMRLLRRLLHGTIICAAKSGSQACLWQTPLDVEQSRTANRTGRVPAALARAAWAACCAWLPCAAASAMRRSYASCASFCFERRPASSDSSPAALSRAALWSLRHHDQPFDPHLLRHMYTDILLLLSCRLGARNLSQHSKANIGRASMVMQITKFALLAAMHTKSLQNHHKTVLLINNWRLTQPSRSLRVLDSTTQSSHEDICL